jgi:DNA processing protein
LPLLSEREACVAFNLTDKIGSVGVGELAERFGGISAAWESYEGKISRKGGAIDVKGEFDKARRYGVRILTQVDDEYPDMLRKTRGHPLVLYVKGDVKALSMPSVSIVGTRRATSYGLDQANRFGHDLAQSGWCVVSGLALGIDAEAHKGALAAGGVAVGVLGSALDRFYPEQNRELARDIVKRHGAVVSEFPFGREPDQQTFPQRNHVVAALALGVVAIEAPVKSGTLITTSIAADIGRTVMAVPGRVDSPRSAGCLDLIRNGATLVRCAADVSEALSAFAPPPKAKSETRRKESRLAGAPSTAPAFTVEESMVMREITSEGLSMDKLVQLTGLSASKVSSLCMMLRLKERVRFLPGNRVALPRQT